MPDSTLPQACAQLAQLGAELFESSPDCVKLLDAQGHVLAMNQNGQCAMEIDDFNLVNGKEWATLWPQESRALLSRELGRARAGGVGHFSAFCPTGKGQPRWWDVTITHMLGQDGGDERLLAVSRDITASHHREAELRASEARLRALITASSAIVWTGPLSGEFDSEQPGWAAFTGQRRDEYMGRGWLQAIHPDDRAHTVATWTQAVATCTPYLAEHRVRRADGEYRYMSAKAVPVPAADGTPHEWVGVHTDITQAKQAVIERERMEAEIQAASFRLSEAFREAPTFMCIQRGPDFVYEMFNERYAEIVGGRAVVGKSMRELLPEIEGQGYFEKHAEVLATGIPFTGTDLPVFIADPAGGPPKKHYLDVRYSALRDADGTITGVMTHGLDQTERKLAEIALFESRERFQKIVSQAATGVVQIDSDGNVSFVNQKFCDMVGFAEHELVGRSVAAITAPESVPQTIEAVARLREHGVGFVIDKEYLRKDGSTVPATTSVNMLSGPNGEYQGLVAIVLDVSERKAAANQLLATEQRYRTLFNSTDQGVCILDMIFGSDGRAVDYRLVEFNNSFKDLSGLTDEAVGRTANEVIPGLEQRWFDAFGKVARSGTPVRLEADSAAMDGRWFDTFATPMAGHENRVAILLRDVTERRKTEENLRRLAADLSEVDQRKTEFLATLAHELRNPLAPIRSGLNVMRLGGDSPATVARVREMLERQVQHMVRLIDDLLDIARISSGKLDLRRARADVVGILGNAVETSLPLIEARQHKLTVDIPDGALEADVDVHRIAQVVANLLNNAAKYTPPGGTIHMAARARDNEIVVSVTDNGVGIPAESLRSVFDMFAQIDRDVDRAQGGLGIGLSLVSRLVQMHGGSVSAASEGIGHGSTFEVRLPLLAPLAGTEWHSAVPEQEAMPRAGHKVMVVDDNTDAASTLAMILDAIGHQSSVASSGEEALRMVAEARPDAIFLDIGMPGMDGYDTARALRALPHMADVVLIALTGWGAAEDRVRSRDAGFDHHLTKPVELSAVEAILNQLDQAAAAKAIPA